MRPEHGRKGAAVRRFARSPKGYLLRYLLVLVLVAAPGEPAGSVAINIVTASAAGIGLDVTLERLRKGRWIVPDGPPSRRCCVR